MSFHIKLAVPSITTEEGDNPCILGTPQGRCKFYIHSNLALPELAIPDPLLYRTDCAKICQSVQFRRGSFLL